MIEIGPELAKTLASLGGWAVLGLFVYLFFR